MKFHAQIDLFSTPLERTEGGPATLRIPVLPEGQFDHGTYGKLEWTTAKFAQMVANFEDKVTEHEPMLNFDHATHNPLAAHAPAAGWITRLEAVPGVGLDAVVELTDLGEEAIRNRRYRYISAEVGKIKNSRGKTFDNVIVGAALTNTPFHGTMRGLFSQEEAPALCFSTSGPATFWAAAGERAAAAAGGGSMDLGKTLRRLFRLPETATDEDLVVAAVDRSAQAEPVLGLSKAEPLIAGEPLKDVVMFTAEEATRLRAEAAEAATLRQQIAEREEAAKLEKATAAVDGLIQAGKILPAAKEQALRFAQADLDAFTALYAQAPVVVDTTARGIVAGANGSEPQGSAAEFSQLIAQIQREEKCSYGEAAELASQRRPDLYEAHRAQTVGRA